MEQEEKDADAVVAFLRKWVVEDETSCLSDFELAHMFNFRTGLGLKHDFVVEEARLYLAARFAVEPICARHVRLVPPQMGRGGWKGLRLRTPEEVGRNENQCAQDEDRKFGSPMAHLDEADWMREVLKDFRIPFDDHPMGRRLALTQWMRDHQR